MHDIVRVKMAGIEERAKAMETHLRAVEADAAAFSTEISDQATRIRRLEEINATIIAAIDAHRTDVEIQIAVHQAQEEELQRQLDALVMPTVTPAPNS